MGVLETKVRMTAIKGFIVRRGQCISIITTIIQAKGIAIREIAILQQI